MNTKQYVGDLIGGSLFVAESRAVAELLLQQPSLEDFNHVIVEDNLLQKNSPQTAKRYAKTIRTRIEPMGETYLNALVTANETVARQLLLAAFLNNSPIAQDFLRYSVADARRAYQEKLSDFSWGDFFDERIRAFPELGKFSETSVKKMGNNLFKALADAGYIDTARKKQLRAVYIEPDVRALLEQQGMTDVIKVMDSSA